MAIDKEITTLKLMHFQADWCAACQTMTPILQQVLNKLPGEVEFIAVDIDKNPQIAAAFRVRSVPSLILFQKGKLLWRHAGLINTKELQQQIARHL